MLKTITLETALTFQDAMEQLLAGKCLGIRPGNNTNFVELYKPNWMNQKSPDFFLRWHGDEDHANIRSNQYLEPWFPVIVDHRSLRETTAAAN